jgi:hypothetical protein
LDISGTVPSPQGVPVTAQAITFGTAPAPTYSPSGSFQVTASASSGLAVSFSSLTASVCNTSSTSSPAAVSILTAGTCTIAANQVGNSNYSAAPQTTQSVSIAKANQTITWSSLNSLQVGANGTLSASGGASGSAIVFTSATPAVCTVAGSNVTAVAAGTCVLAADQAGNTNYNAAPQATASLTVISAAPTSIPTLSEWGMIILSGLMALGAFMVMRRRPS